jgi:hypothetical protein
MILASGASYPSVMTRARRIIGSACFLGDSAILLFGEGGEISPLSISLLFLGTILVATARRRWPS